MADTPILNYKGKYDGPEIDKAVELALGLENPESCPYYVHVSLSHPDYVLTVGLGDAEGDLFNYAEIDLPLESMVVNATYINGSIILHLQDGTSTEPIPISALIAGLVSETRTIAGIDLKDDITPKELRDALDVYTKDSVDQLVSNLENRIDETLYEHDTQIKKNTSDIAINKSDISSVENELARVETSLQNQINSIVLEASGSGDVTAEVIQARVDINGTTYGTLKARIDAEQANVNNLSDMVEAVNGVKFIKEFTERKFINLNSEPIDLTPLTNNYYRCTVIDCVEGDVYTINGATDGNARLYAFIDAEKNILIRGGVNANADKLEIVAPANSAFLAVNLKTQDGDYVIKGHLLDGVVKDINEIKETTVIQSLIGLEIATKFFYIVDETGVITNSNNWRARIYDVSDIAYINNTYSYSNSVDYVQIGFYNSDTFFDSSTYISGIKFGKKNNKSELALVAIPDGAKCMVLTSRHATATDYAINAVYKNGVSTTKKEKTQLKDMTLRKSTMKFGAHQGLRGEAPANTIPAFKLAGEKGWDYLWLAQCRMSADGTWYVMHNETVDETTNGTGYVSELSDEYINSLYVDTGNNIELYSESDRHIPTVEEAIQICHLYGMGACFRCTDIPQAYSTVEEKAKMDSWIDLIKSNNMANAIFSADAPRLKALREATNEEWEACLFLGDAATADNLIIAFNQYGLTNNLSVLININVLTQEEVKKLHRLGIKVYAYKAADVTQTQLYNACIWGVDIFQNGYKNQMPKSN